MAEYIDLLNEDGVKTGEILTRKEVHAKGLWHRAIVIAIINEKNEILLLNIMTFLSCVKTVSKPSIFVCRNQRCKL